MPFIEIKNLKVSYQNNSITTLALNDVNVSFNSEKITAIVGPSGCGKTTLIKTICGFLDYEGMIYADGEDYSLCDYKKRNISYVDQSTTLNPNIDLYNNIAASLIINKIKRQEIDQRVKRMAAILGIEKYLSLFPNQLSKGQCQLALLAKAMIKNPTLILFDEAFGSLDTANKQRFFALVKEQQKEYPFTMLFVTHNHEDLFALADYVVMMKNGAVDSVIDKNDKRFNYMKEKMENNNGNNNEF